MTSAEQQFLACMARVSIRWLGLASLAKCFRIVGADTRRRQRQTGVGLRKTACHVPIAWRVLTPVYSMRSRWAAHSLRWAVITCKQRGSSRSKSA